MTKVNNYICDNCGMIMENAECHIRQLMFTLRGNSDYEGEVHFCGIKCLAKYTTKLTSPELKEYKQPPKEGE